MALNLNFALFFSPSSIIPFRCGVEPLIFEMLIGVLFTKYLNGLNYACIVENLPSMRIYS